MKKPILGMIIGGVLGVIAIISIVIAISANVNKQNAVGNNTESTVTEGIATEEIRTEETWFTEIVEETEIETEVTEVVEEDTQPPQVTTPPAQPVNIPYYIRVNRMANCVTVYAKDAAGNYTVPVKSMICSVGLTDETPLGVYSIYARYVWRPLFGGSYGQYTLRFYGHFLFHSVPYSQTSKDSLLEGAFNKLGEPASQGCVRLMVIDAKWLYDNCVNGTKVEVYDSPDPGPLGKPAGYKINPNSPYRGWDPTDPDPANPWKNGVVTLTGVKDVTVNQGETANLLAGVTAKDVDGMPLTVTVSDTVDWNTPGVYKVTYTATGVLGMVATVDANVTVNAVEQPEPEDPETPETPETPGQPEEPENPENPEGADPSEGVETPQGEESSQAEEYTEEQLMN